MKYAVISNDVVENIIDAETGFAIEGKLLIEFGSNCEVGGTYNAETGFSKAVEDETKINLKIVKERRKRVIQKAYDDEIDAGFTYGGNTFDFDDITLGIIGARLSYNEAKESPTTADLTFYNSDKSAVIFADKIAFKSFCIGFILARNTIDQKRITLKAQVNACTAKEQIEAISWQMRLTIAFILYMQYDKYVLISTQKKDF